MDAGRLIRRAALLSMLGVLACGGAGSAPPQGGAEGGPGPVEGSTPPTGASDDAAAATPTATTPRAIGSADDATAALGQRVRVTGTAQNAKASAVLTRDELVIYCLDLPAWDKAQHGTELTLEGVLESTDELTATTGPAGEISQGTDGPVFALRPCRVVAPAE